MRWHLLTTFDKIFVLDLHGSSKKKEISPDGSPDKNVFDIQQGVSIIIAVKQNNKTGKKELARLFHRDLWGGRSSKYEALWDMELEDEAWAEITPTLPNLLFTPQNQDLKQRYDQGFSIVDFMPLRSVGIVTARDALTLDMDKDKLWARVKNFREIGIEEARSKYKLGPDAQDWKVESAQKDVNENFSEELVVKMAYRPYDIRWTYYTGTSRGFHCRPRAEVMKHMAGKTIWRFAFPAKAKMAWVVLSSQVSQGIRHSARMTSIVCFHCIYIRKTDWIECLISSLCLCKKYRSMQAGKGIHCPLR
jgi:hypothetical protein